MKEYNRSEVIRNLFCNSDASPTNGSGLEVMEVSAAEQILEESPLAIFNPDQENKEVVNIGGQLVQYFNGLLF